MFDDMAQGAAWDDLQRVHGSSATFKADGTGSGSSVTILFNRNQSLPGYYEDGAQDVKTAVARAAPVDVSGYGLSTTFTIGGEVWAVVAIGRELPIIDFQLEHRIQIHKGEGARIKR